VLEYIVEEMLVLADVLELVEVLELAGVEALEQD
jgi:hypothetical protein